MPVLNSFVIENLPWLSQVLNAVFMKFCYNLIFSFFIVCILGVIPLQAWGATTIPLQKVPTLELRFSTAKPCEEGGLYCANVQLKVLEFGETVNIGTSGIFFEYNASALEYVSYTSINFDPEGNCIPFEGAPAAWDEHGFDGSEPGKFNIVLSLEFSDFSCPTIGAEWVDVGEVCFNVLDATETTELAFSPDPTLTSFNTNDNDGILVDVDRDNYGNVDELPTGGADGVNPPVISAASTELCQAGTGEPSSLTITADAAPLGYTYSWQLNGNPLFTNQVHEVEVGNHYFAPQDLTIVPGDTVRWTNVDGFHNVNGTELFYPNNPDEFYSGSPAGAPWTYEYVFTEAGFYEYQCEPHVDMGMTGTITVQDLSTLSATQAGDYSLIYTPTENGCPSTVSNTVTITTIDCSGPIELACPTVNPSNDTQIVCAGDFDINTILNAWQNVASISDPDNTAGNFVMSSVPTDNLGFPTTPPTGVYGGDGCSTDTQVWYLGLECNKDGETTYIAAGSLQLNIFPSPQAPTLMSSFIEASQTCIYSFEPNCPNDSFDVDPISLNESCGSTNLPNVQVNVTNQQGCTAGPFAVAKPDCQACDQCLTVINSVNTFCQSSTSFLVSISYGFSNVNGGLPFTVVDQNNNVVGSFTYGEEINIGPFDIDGITYSFEIVDGNDSSCRVSTGDVAEPDCGSACEAEAGTVSLSDNIFCVNDLVSLEAFVSGVTSNNSYELRWFITNAAGNIINDFSEGGPDLTGLSQGTYCMYTISYETANPHNQSALHIDDIGIGDGCYDLSECALFDFYTNMPQIIISTVPICNNDGTYSVGLTAQGGSGNDLIIEGLPNSPVTVTPGQENPFTLMVGTNYPLTVEDSFTGCTGNVSTTIQSPNCQEPCSPSSQDLVGSEEVCAGSPINLDSFLGLPQGTAISWTDANINIIGNPNNITLSTNNCNGETQTYIASYVLNDANNCPVNYTSTLNLFVYPTVTANITTSDCSVSISQDCNNFLASWSDNLGNNGNGFSYTATEGTNGTVTFTVANNLSNLCDNFTIQGNFNCPTEPSCPTVPVVSNTTDDICSGFAFNLNSYINVPGGTTVTWTDGGGASVANPNMTLSNTSCVLQTYVYTASYTLTDANDCVVEYEDNVSLDVYPEITGSISLNACVVSVTENCANFTATWADNLGNSGAGYGYTVTPGTAGMVTFSIVNSTAPNDCKILSLQQAFDCPPVVECPDTPVNSTGQGQVCSGESFDLNDYITVPAGANVTWVDGINAGVNNTTLLLENTSCSNETFLYTASYSMVNADDCTVEYNIELSISVYPEVSADVDVNECVISVTPNCPTFTASWINNLGESGSGNTYTAEGGMTGVVSFTIFSNDGGNCSNLVINQNYDCPMDCPLNITTLSTSNDKCSGANFSLNEGIEFPMGVSVSWNDSEGNIITNPNNVSIENSSCTMESYLYTASYSMTDANGCPEEYIVNLTLNIYPTIAATTVENECSVSLETCSNYTVTWTNSMGDSGTGTTYNAEAGMSGSVTFSVSQGGNPPANCTMIQVQGNYDCPMICDNAPIIENHSRNLCSGAAFSLNENIDFPIGVSVTWQNSGGIVVSNPFNVVIENTTCAMEEHTYTATYSMMDNDGCPIEYIHNLSIEVYPTIVATPVSNECSVSLETCSNYTVTWTNSMGDSGTGTTYNAEAGMSGSVTFSVSQGGNPPANCATAQIQANYNCPVICDNAPVVENHSRNLCSGASFYLGENIDLPTAANVTWQDAAGTVISNPFNVVIENITCEMVEHVYIATYTMMDNNNCPVEYTHNLSVEVYPLIVANANSSGCSVSLEMSCPNFEVTWIDNLGGSGTGSVYTATTGTVGNVTFTISQVGNPPANCASTQEQASFDCSIICDNPPVTETHSRTICSGVAFSLNENLTFPLGVGVTWYDGLGVIPNPNNISIDNFDCDLITFGFYATYTTVDADGCPTEHTTNLLVEVYPNITAEVTNGACAVSISQECPAFEATWTDMLGNTGTGFTYVAAEGTNGMVTFKVSLPDACSDAVYQGNFDCPEATIICDNPMVTDTSNISICAGTTLDLSTLLNVATSTTVTWMDEAGITVNPTDVELNNPSCTSQTYLFTATYSTTDNEGCPIEHQHMLLVEVYPALQGTLVSEGCGVGVETVCANFLITWTDSEGNAGTGNSYNGLEGTSGTVTFSIDNPFDADDCGTLELTGNFDCPMNCNNEVITSSEELMLCAGSSINLNEQILVPAGAEVTWTNDSGSTVNSSNLITLENTSCNIQTNNFTANYTTLDDNGCPINHTITLTVNIFPIVGGVVQTGTCGLNIEPSCPDFTVSWTDDLGGSGNGMAYTATEGTAGNVIFTVSNPGGLAECSTTTLEASFDCPINCNNTPISSVASVELCGGETLNLNSFANTTASIIWTGVNGQVINNANNLTLNNATCNIQTNTYTGNYLTTDANGCPTENTLTLTATVYPSINANIVDNGCVISLNNACSDWMVSWNDNLGNTGSGFQYTAASGTEGTVTFAISSPFSPQDCNFGEVSTSFNCPIICGVQVIENDITASVCEYEIFSISELAGLSNMEALVWTNGIGNIVSNANNLSLTNPSCSPQTYLFTTDYNTNDEQGCPVENYVSFIISVYPQITASTTSGDCMINLSQDCPNFMATWQDDAGNTGDGFTYNATEGTAGEVTFMVEGENCTALVISETYDCNTVIEPEPTPVDTTTTCETIFVTETVGTEICNGSSINLFDYLDVAPSVAIEWVNGIGNPLANTTDVVLENANGCIADNYQYIATYEVTDINNCTTQYEITLNVSVYPTIEAEMISSECESLTLETACPNYVVSWADDNGNNGTNNVYEIPEGSGSITFTVSNPLATNCGEEIYSYAYSCVLTQNSVDLALVGNLYPEQTANVGDTVSYNLVISNGGPAMATGITTQINVPEGFNYLGMEGDGNYTGLQDLWILMNGIATGESAACTLRFEAEQVGTFEFGATVVGVLQEDNNLSDNTTLSNIIINIEDTNEGGGNNNDDCQESYNCGIFTLECVEANAISEICPEFCSAFGYDYELTEIQVGASSAVSLDGSCFTYTPSPLANVQGYETLMVTAENTEGACATLTVQMTIDACNTPPQANDDFYDVDESGSLSFNPTENDEDNEGDALVICGDFTQPANGTLTLEGDNFIYVPNDGFSGTDSFTYTVCDENGESSLATVFIDVPGYVEACDDQVIEECTGVVEPLVMCVEYCQFGSISFAITNVETTFDCTIVLLDDLCFRYTPLPSTPTGVDEIQIVGCSELLDDCQTLTGFVTVGNCDGNLPPEGTEDNATTIGTDPITINVLANDSDPDGDDLSICAYTQPSFGTVEDNNDGTFTYQADGDYSGIDNFTYTVCDVNGASTIVSVAIEVEQPACNNNQSLCTPIFTALTVCIDFCGSDMKIGEDGIDIPFHCSIVQEGDLCFRYTPLPAFMGTETITVEGCNDAGNCETAIVTIEVGDGCETEGFRVENTRLNDISQHEQCSLMIPNVFTPNNDGINDVVKLTSLTECYNNFDVEFMVFDKMGRSLFVTDDVQQGILWDGQNAFSDGTYYYRLIIRYEGERLDKVGFIELRK